MSVKDFPMEHDAHGTVTGIGGRQAIGCPIPCDIKFDSDEKKTYKVAIKPMELKSTKNLVISFHYLILLSSIGARNV